MSVPTELIGLKGFSIARILEIIENSQIYGKITTEWDVLANKLQVSSELIEKMHLNILLGKHSRLEVLEDVLIDWKMRCGNEATLIVFTDILDKGCNWQPLAEDIRGINTVHKKTQSCCLQKQFSWKNLCHAERGELLGKQVHFLGRKQKLFEIGAKMMDRIFLHILEETLQDKNLEELAYSPEYALTIDTIPEASCYYMPRNLTPYTLIKPAALAIPGTDIFLVEGISWNELSFLVRPAETDRSTNQLNQVNVQYIHLDNITHFDEICKITTRTVHLLSYREARYSWGKTRGDMSKILEFLSGENNAISEKAFVNAHMHAQNTTAICIWSGCGTGKSELFKSLARNVRIRYSDRLVILLHFNDITSIFPSGEEVNISSIRRAITSLVSHNKLGECLLYEALSCNKYRTELFLDGYDDVLPGQKPLVKKIIAILITTTCSNIRVILTSRYEMGAELNMPSRFLCYSIQPFHLKQEKVEYLLSHWRGKFGLNFNENLQQFAYKLLKYSVTEQEYQREEMIAGFPLRASMLTDVFSETAEQVTYCESSIAPERNTSMSLYNIYSRYLTARLSDKKEDYKMKCLKQAIAAVYLTTSKQESISRQDDDILELDIFEPSTTTIRNSIRFKHKTFAEFLTAQLFVDILMQKRIFDGLDICSILKFCLKTSTLQNSQIQLTNAALCYFLDAIMLENNLLQQDKCLSAIKTYVTTKRAISLFSTSQPSVTAIMSACMLNQHYAIFSLLAYCFISPDNSSLASFTALEPDEWKTLVLCTARNGSIELVKKVWQLWETAVDGGNEEICKIKFHLQKYFDVDLTPLHVAAQRGSFRIFHFIFEKYTNNTDALKGLLHVTVGNSYNNAQVVINEKLEIVDFLVKRRGKEVLEEVTDELPEPLLSPEIHLALIKNLIQNRANILSTTPNLGTVAHNTASYLTASEYHDLVQYLVGNRKAHIFKYRNHLHETPLHIAVRCMKIRQKTIELLVTSGEVDMDSEFGHQDTILYHLIRCHYPVSSLMFALKHSPGWAGADMAYKDGSTTLLHVASSWGHVEALCYFLSLGPDANAVNNENKTPLHLACTKQVSSPGKPNDNVMSIVMALINHGADVNALDNKGNPPLSYAFDDS